MGERLLRSSPSQSASLPTRRECQIDTVRLARRCGPARIAYLLGVNPSTVHRVCGSARPAHPDRATAAPVRRYEHAAPGGLVHVAIKKPGNIPAGGSHKVYDRVADGRNSSASRDPTDRATSTAVRIWATPSCTTPWTTTSAWPTPEILADQAVHITAAF